jgi:cardiolipin synthase A/B
VRKSLSIILPGILGLYLWLFFAATTPKLPDAENPILFYSNQHRQDLKQLFSKAIENAKKSINLYMYAVTDPDMIELLAQKASQGVRTSIFFDPSASCRLEKKREVEAYPIICKGLMHRKILIIDDEQIYLGSANMTTQSLKIHDNLVLGLFHRPLAQALEDPTFLSFNFNTGGQNGELFLLPDKTDAALDRIVELIAAAKNTIFIAMFTLTHPKLIQALAEACQRNVDVKVAVDFYTGQGASLKSLDILRARQIPVFLSLGQQLLHHKWAYIDNSILISGSANWTKAAFAHNQDCFLVLNNLTKKQKKIMNKICKIIYLESI